MPGTNVRPPAVVLGDQAVEAMYALARDIRSAAPMRQQPLFDDEDEAWLEAARRGMVGIVLRVAFVLHAEASGALPLGNPTYDRSLALTPVGEAPDRSGAWKRLLRISAVLSGSQRPPRGVAIQPFGGALFDSAWLGAFVPAGSVKTRDDNPLVPSDQAIHDVVRALQWVDKQPVAIGSVEVEQIAALYERLIGFEIIRCAGRSLRMGTSRIVVDLDALHATVPAKRAAKLADLGLKPTARVLAKLEAAQTFDEVLLAIRGRRRTEPLPPGAIVLQPNLARRRAGAHYTPPEVAREVVRATLQPLLDRTEREPERILALRVCDPSMGTGAFLIEACRQLADALVAGWQDKGCPEADGPRDDAERRARLLVASSSLYGVDLDPLAVDLARTSVQLAAMGPQGALPDVATALRCGDALVGLGPWIRVKEGGGPDAHLLGIGWIPGGRTAFRSALKAHRARTSRPRPTVVRVRRLADRYVRDFLDAHADASPKRALAAFQQGLLTASDVVPRQGRDSKNSRPFHWPLEFPEAFANEPAGFDAFVGNPPWVAFAGRAAQPLARAYRGYYLHVSEAFHGYRTLHGLFVHRCASMLRPGGRLGLVLPTSMSDLDGYAPVRRVHNALCEADTELPDFGGHAFEGVFQPSMALLSTRRAELQRPNGETVWSVRRDDLEPWAEAALARIATLPTMPARAFAERGFQSTREDAPRICNTSTPQEPFVLAIREGADVRAFEALPPRMHLDPTGLGGRLRAPEQFAEVAVFIRQTARYPVAARADGIAFRNSILAGFEVEGWGADALVAYLNAWPVRWLHYMRHRDARQGMPQVKISHLRSLPMPPLTSANAEALQAMGKALGGRNKGITPDEQRGLDAVVAGILGICSNELDAIERWRRDKGFS